MAGCAVLDGIRSMDVRFDMLISWLICAGAGESGRSVTVNCAGMTDNRVSNTLDSKEACMHAVISYQSTQALNRVLILDERILSQTPLFQPFCGGLCPNARMVLVIIC